MAVQSAAARLAAMALVLLVPGCAERGGIAQSPPSTPSGSTQPAVSRTVPPVANPVDIRPHLDRPCSLLSRADLTAIGFGPTADATATTNTCFYSDGSSRGGLSLELSPTRSPLAAAYADDPGQHELSQPMEILGLPAMAQAERSTQKACSLAVGTGSDQGILLVHYPDPGEAPGAAAEVCRQLSVLAQAALSKIGRVG